MHNQDTRTHTHTRRCDGSRTTHTNNINKSALCSSFIHKQIWWCVIIFVLFVCVFVVAFIVMSNALCCLLDVYHAKYVWNGIQITFAAFYCFNFHCILIVISLVFNILFNWNYCQCSLRSNIDALSALCSFAGMPQINITSTIETLFKIQEKWNVYRITKTSKWSIVPMDGHPMCESDCSACWRMSSYVTYSWSRVTAAGRSESILSTKHEIFEACFFFIILVTVAVIV